MHNEHPLIVVASGGFDPLHGGHIAYLNEAALLGDRLVVALASDHALIQKKKTFLMSWEHRKSVLSSLDMIDDVITIDDYYDYYNLILGQLRKRYPSATIVFASGNGPTQYNTPALTDNNIQFKYHVGGNRITSSSSILRTYADYVLNMQEMEAGPNRRYQ